jgi:hypothetical protein
MKCNNCGSELKNKSSLYSHQQKAKYCKVKREMCIKFVKLSLLGLDCRISTTEMKERFKELTGKDF